MTQPPYSDYDYEDAKSLGLDLDDWDDYKEYYNLGNEVLENDTNTNIRTHQRYQ